MNDKPIYRVIGGHLKPLELQEALNQLADQGYRLVEVMNAYPAHSTTYAPVFVLEFDNNALTREPDYDAHANRLELDHLTSEAYGSDENTAKDTY